jgi:hypothetical protein
MIKDLILIVPALVFFLAGGACGALIAAPRLGWYRTAGEPEPSPCQQPRAAHTPDMLEVYAIAATGGLPALQKDALERAAGVFGPDAWLRIETVSQLKTLPSGKLTGYLTVRHLSGQEAADA